MTKLAAAGTAFAVILAISGFLISYTMKRNRETEFFANKRSEPLSTSELHWTFVHMRDDIGGIAVLLGLTNALLAGILAAIVF